MAMTGCPDDRRRHAGVDGLGRCGGHVCFVAGLSAGTVGLPTEERAAALGVARQEAAVLA